MDNKNETQKRILCYKEFLGEFYDAEIAKKLYQMGYFDAPASTRFYGNYPGGLFDHSIAVAKMLCDFTRKYDLKWEHPRSPYYVGLFHDLCKCGMYISNGNGGFKTNPDKEPGHGDLSAARCNQLGMALTPLEVMCIFHHMGPYPEYGMSSERAKQVMNDYSRAVDAQENVLWTHTADMYASHVLKT